MAESTTHINEHNTMFTIKSEGSQIPSEYGIVEIEVSKELNKIATAKIVLNDQNNSEERFPISESNLFVPGKKIEISANFLDGKPNTLFIGIVVSHSIRMKQTKTELIIRCTDEAVKMTTNRHNAYFEEMEDSGIISQLIDNRGLSKDVDSTSGTHMKVVQYQSSDWDFMLSRAQLNGLVVFTDDGKVCVKSPDVSSSPVVELIHGTNISKFDGEIDARTQLKEVTCSAWDMSNQEILTSTSSEPSTYNQGNLSGKKLSEVTHTEAYQLHSTIPLTRDNLKTWANARLLKSRLSRIRGTVLFEGNADVKPNTNIKISGLGSRFDGDAYVSRVKHLIHEGHWETEAGFGLSPEWFTEDKDNINLPPAAGLLPGVEGLRNGVVAKIDEDPDGETRIFVKIPVVEDSDKGVWARLSNPYATSEAGTFFIPEIGDEVVLGFLNNDPRFAVILGMLYSKSHEPPYVPDEKNTYKAIVTRSNMKLEFNDEDVVIILETPAGNRITISDKDKKILIEDENSNTITMDDAGITLDSPKTITLKAMEDIVLDASGKIDIKAVMDVKVEGMNVSQKANVKFSAEGSAQAELKASGQTVIKGAIVMIN